LVEEIDHQEELMKPQKHHNNNDENTYKSVQ
jgi:hypothetical protein